MDTGQTQNNLKEDYKDMQNQVYADYEEVSEDDLLTENIDNSLKNDFPQINADPHTLVNISPDDILKDLNNTIASSVVNADSESFGGSLFSGSVGHSPADSK